MLVQIALGSAVLVASVVTAGLGVWGMEAALDLARPWLTRPPHRPRLIAFLCLAALGFLGIVTATIWLWALTFWALGLFGTLETSVYFATVAFTTLGFGDLLLPQDWRLLGGMAAANGLLMLGLLTALMLDAARHVRGLQTTRGRDRP